MTNNLSTPFNNIHFYNNKIKGVFKLNSKNISNTISDLGWRPQIGLEEGLKKSIKYFETIL